MYKKPLYFGFDESNHGKFPEIFVLTYTNKKKLTEAGNYGKKRDNSKQNELIKNKYLHTIITEEENRLFLNDDVLRSFVSLGSLLLEFPQNQGVVYIDGNITDSFLESICELTYNKFDLIFGPKLDRTIPIVNIADGIANKLFRYYTQSNTKPKNRFIENLIKPDFKTTLKIAQKYF